MVFSKQQPVQRVLPADPADTRNRIFLGDIAFELPEGYELGEFDRNAIRERTNAGPVVRSGGHPRT
jgi:hypothetical protein